MPERTLTFVSHTHWDREWYQPFEEFRIRLVQMVDKLLHILDTDPEYLYFMLDGQTVVVEDYLAIRPEQESRIAEHVRSGRLLIGPWHILPDEFLVSPESTVRNLIVGSQVAERYGRRMDVGHIPDPFGHISQLPQILRGFDLDTAAFWRGVDEAPNEFWWEAPDGSKVLVIHQHNGYGNAAGMPVDPEAFLARTQAIADALIPTATTPHLLAMNGSDHQEAQAELPSLLAAANAALSDLRVRHGTLSQFVDEIRAADPDLLTRRGELRHGSRMPLLPGVLSARMWIKQRNAACETLLTSWAEPLAAIAELVGAPLELHKQSALVRQAWRYLLQNHPHDSICGCSIDQVHREMDVRFDLVDQIGEAVVEQCLEGIANVVDTSSDEDGLAVVVFNPATRERSGWVSLQTPVPEGDDLVVLTSGDQEIHPQLGERRRDVVWQVELSAEQLASVVGQRLPETIEGSGIQAMDVSVDGSVVHVGIRVAQGLAPDRGAIEEGRARLKQILDAGAAQQASIMIHRGWVANCGFVAQDVPGLGYRTYLVCPTGDAAGGDSGVEEPPGPAIENELLRVKVAEDGTVSMLDKRTGVLYEGLNRFVDVGDRGDEYNYCPVEEDTVIAGPSAEPLVCATELGPDRQTLEVSMTYRVPLSLDEARSQRSEELVDLPITTRLTLVAGSPRLEFETVVENGAADHRLRAHFAVPVSVDRFHTEGHYDVIARPLDLPQDTAAWVEQPVPTYPQRSWADVSDGHTGLMVANRGLPEAEALRTEGRTEVALTLLRCVGWLSRSDMSVRQGHAGPGLPTPEAQCIGEHMFHYALIPHAGEWQTVLDEAHAFAVPLRAVSTTSHPGSLTEVASLVEVKPSALVVSAIKEAETGEGLVVRFWNTSTERVEGTVRFWRQPSRVSRRNLAEREIGALDIRDDGAVCVPLGPRQVATILGEFD